LLGVAVGRFHGVVDVEEADRISPDQQRGVSGQIGQQPPRHRLKLQHVPKSKGAQERSAGRGGSRPTEDAVHPPVRSKSMSSMLSAPATIPATSALTLTGALHPPGLVKHTCSPTRSNNPARSANAITGTNTTADTKLSSSKLLKIVCGAWESRT